MFSFFSKKSAPETRESSSIFLKNTLSGKKEAFVPLHEGHVKMYNCGPTVYDHVTVGNFASFVMADVLKRAFLYNGFKVEQLINITDFGHLSGDNDGDSSIGDDRMTKGLKREGMEVTMENMTKLASKYADSFLDDVRKLYFDTKGTRFPKASEYIREQIILIKTLEEKGYTYVISDGVYFDTAKFKEYGKLGNINLEGQKAGARVETKDRRNPSDFVLWKKDDAIGWSSPWGKGFPGWHIECTAMIFSLLGKQIDVHTGGEDHISIHHNNEIAQAEAATGRKFVNYWLHKTFITIDNMRIGKSVGNAFGLTQLEGKGYTPLAYRYWLLTGHYSSSMNFTWEALDGAQQALTRIHRFFVEELPQRNGTVSVVYKERFREAINDDLDTPKGIAILWELVKDESIEPKDKRATLLDFDTVLGIGLADGVKKLKEALQVNVVSTKDLSDEVKMLVEKREKAREEKNFDEADMLRDQIQKEGYTLKDTDEGTILNKL